MPLSPQLASEQWVSARTTSFVHFDQFRRVLIYSIRTTSGYVLPICSTCGECMIHRASSTNLNCMFWPISPTTSLVLVQLRSLQLNVLRAGTLFSVCAVYFQTTRTGPDICTNIVHEPYARTFTYKIGNARTCANKVGDCTNMHEHAHAFHKHDTSYVLYYYTCLYHVNLTLRTHESI